MRSRTICKCPRYKRWHCLSSTRGVSRCVQLVGSFGGTSAVNTTCEIPSWYLLGLSVLAPRMPGNNQVPFESLRETLGMEEEVLKRVLHSLSCGKHQVRGFCSARRPPPPLSIATAVDKRADVQGRVYDGHVLCQ